MPAGISCLRIDFVKRSASQIRCVDFLPSFFQEVETEKGEFMTQKIMDNIRAYLDKKDVPLHGVADVVE